MDETVRTVQAPQPAASAPASTPDLTAYALLRLPVVLLRRVLIRLMLIGAWMQPRLGSVLLTTVLLGVIAVESLALLRTQMQPAADTRVAAIVPAEAVTMFLQGQREYNIDMVWDALSPDLQAMLIGQGLSKEAIAAQLASERSAGQRYTKAEYVGGVSVDDNQTMFFYVVHVSSPDPNRNGKFSFVFTVDRSGKISSLTM